MERLMAISIFLLGAVTAVIGFRQILFAWSMRHWPAAEGEVRSSSVLELRSARAGSSRLYRPEILYAFTVDGMEYTGVRRTLYAINCGGSDSPAKVVAQYPVGRRVMVYYDPVNPRESILIRESAFPSAVFVTVIGLFFSGVLAHWLLR
jgi:hypothetical protein